MPPRIPEAVQPVLTEYLRLLNKTLPGFLIGFYLHGSLALDAFNPHSSDIDFVAVASRLCTEEDREGLRLVHATVAKAFPRWEFSGCYLISEDLGRFGDTIPSGTYFNDGTVATGIHHDINSVTWWVLKNRGIAVVGPEPEALSFTVDWDRLVAEMSANLNTYWRRFTRKPERIAWLLKDSGIEWAVLGVLRQYYTFHTKDISSKTGAGRYALGHLPVRWHRLIQEAIHLREHTGGSSYPSRLVRAFESWLFLRYVIRSCNRFLKIGGG